MRTRFIRLLKYKCPPFPLQFTIFTQNGYIFMFTLRLVMQLGMAFLPLGLQYEYYRAFESVGLLLLSIGAKLLTKCKPKYGYIFNGIIGMILTIVYFECTMISYGGEIGLYTFFIINAISFNFMDFFKYYFVMLAYQLIITMYISYRAMCKLVYLNSYDLFSAVYYGALSVSIYGTIFYVFTSALNLINDEIIQKQKTLQNWKSLMQTLPLGIVILSKTKILFSNTYAVSLMGQANLDISFHSINQLLTNYDTISHTKQSVTIRAEHKYIFCEKQEIEFDGLSAVVCILNDLTHVFEAQQQKQEQHAVEMFVATSTHELRTPLHIIKNTLEMMLEEADSEQSEFIAKSLNACEMQECYINDILDYAKMKAGKLSLIIEPYSIKEILTEIYSYFATMALDAQLTFEIDCKNDDLIVPIDYIRFKQILFNLISNSLKFTLNGGIKLRGYENNGKAIVEIKDTGIGMTECELTNLFKAFGMIESTRSLNKSGTGLGLFLCKTLSLLMKCEISVESKKNIGTTFILTFTKLQSTTPVVTRSAKRQRICGSKTVKISYKILIVDDNNFNCQILEKMLSTLGILSYKALNGIKAMEFIKMKADIRLVLLDLHMPIINGYELLKLIQEYYKSTSASIIKVFALTGDSTDEVKRKCQEAGFNGFLSKPFSRDALIDLIHNC